MSLLSKQGLSLIIKAFKKLLSFKADQEEITQSNWQQNDPTKNDYVRGRTHWESYETIVHVDNLTKADYLNEVYPKCNFIPGNVYRVVWNGQVYDRLVCYREDECNVIASENLGCPFYIDDDGGNGFYIGGDFLDNDAYDFVVSVIEERNVVHKIDEKYLPDIVETPDWNQNDPNAKNYIKNRPFYEETGYITCIPEQTVSCEINGINAQAHLIFDTQIPYNAICRVTFDGTVYDDIATYESSGDMSVYVIFTTMDGDRISICDSSSISVPGALAGEHTIKVEQRQVTKLKTIENKYLGFPVYPGSASAALVVNDVGNRALGDYSFAEGVHTTAAGYSSHAEGKATGASGENSHAEGAGTNAAGSTSHAEGYDTTASGYVSHAEGYSTAATGYYSHTEGYCTSAIGNSQSVSGKYNIAEPLYHMRQHVLTATEKICSYSDQNNLYICDGYSFDSNTGLYTLVPVQYDDIYSGDQVMISVRKNVYMIFGGKSGNTMYYNKDAVVYVPQNTIYANQGTTKFTSVNIAIQGGKYLSIVGNGSSASKRSNAYTLDWDGNGWFAGTLKIGGTGQDDETAKEIADKPYVDTLNTETRNYVDAAKSFTLLRDEETGARYHVFMKNGALTTTPMCSKIRITTLPDSIDYLPGDLFDPTGMVVEAVHEDGSSTVITDYTYPTEVLENGRTSVVIGYTEFGQTFTVNLIDTILVDFEWEDNQDGTVTIVGWNETLNGKPSTELIVPDYDWICI